MYCGISSMSGECRVTVKPFSSSSVVYTACSSIVKAYVGMEHSLKIPEPV